ncbi:ABC-type transport auxiliary lipoprotein family protein [Halomonadaceae bacterium KBTZ08]
MKQASALTVPLRLVTLVAITFVGACSVLPQPNRYELYQLAPSSLNTQGSTLEADSLQIRAPRTDDLTRTNRVVVRQQGQRLSAWSGIRWVSPAPELWRDQLLDALHNTGAFHTLGTPGANLNTDLELTGHLRAFHLDQTQDPPQAVIRFDAQLTGQHQGGIQATRRFEVTETLTANTPASAATAMSAATDRMAEQLLDWMESID